MEFDNNKYKKITMLKIIFMAIAIALPIVAELLMIPYYIQTFHNDQSHARICAGILVVFVEIICVWKLSCYIRVITSKEYAEKYYIRAHDERLTLIDRKANTLTTIVSIYLVGFAAAIAGCFDAKVFFTLLVVFFVMILVYGLSYLYFNKKN